jgi:diacylglycerol kinase (ATP)
MVSHYKECESVRLLTDVKPLSQSVNLKPDRMRAAAILGLGSSAKNLLPFQKNCAPAWTLGLPTSSSEADVILIFGGDGTIHRHLAALVALQLPVLVVPCGSGNDFARALNLRSVEASLGAWKKFVAGTANIRTIDLGVITPLGADISSTYFCCAGGIGLDAEIARRANRIPRWLRSHGGYVLSMVPALVRFQPVMTRIFSTLNERSELKSAKLIFVAVFANTPFYGGGMKIAPRALLDDGQLDVCIVSNLGKFKLFCLFPTVYFGRHLQVPEVEYFQSARLRIETETPLDVYADGEYVCRTPIEVSVAPQALRVVTG